jgi:Leucine-rich repeat (LRR) protein
VLELCLKNNHFIKPPDEIWAMKNLVVLNLSGNCLSALPVRIGSLYALQVLDASHNEIKTLHESLGNLTDLRTLNLNSNRLRTLAPGVLPKSLEQLYVEKNLFTQFPQAIHQLPNIVVVSVAKNKIKPADLKEHLQRLEGPDDSENTTSSSSSNHSTSTGNSPENESQKKDDPIAEVTTAFQELMPPSSGMN